MIQKLLGSKPTFSKISARNKAIIPFWRGGRFVNPRRGREARNLTTNVPKILDLKSSSEQIFCKNCRWVPMTQVPNMVRLFEKKLTAVWTQWYHYLQCGRLPFPPFSTKKYMKLILLLITLRFRVVNNI